MIKIIRKGSPKTVEETCKKCHSLFSFEREDLIEEEAPNKTSIKYIIKCPICNEIIKYKNHPFNYFGSVKSNVIVIDPPKIEEGKEYGVVISDNEI